ncbi:hypothetical protein CBR_g34477 [Chara braunii]|uniref:RING-type E3 ubiquitin transferase n=1 Tax=Chara braunii TaxID=69332 RepID=A0A388LIY1_CHABU|nr:hypothetical protein CBR_g34477 [Chara braunii]|eukprot:GBG82195.1 hypothetical protein CBR_g34477 [Chara braunii]
MSRMAVTASLAAAARLSQERRDAEAMPSTSVSFPTAAQPEIMRAAEKDEQYLKHVCDACFDAVRHLMGIGVAIKYSAEIKMAGAALYHSCTTGMGLQTLGEEYCDIMQVDEGRGLLPSIPRRTAMILLETVMPYAINRLSTQVSARGLALALQDNPEPSGSQMSPLGGNVGNAAAMNLEVEDVQQSQSGDTGILPSTNSSSAGNSEHRVDQDDEVHIQDHGGDGPSLLSRRQGRVSVSGVGTDSIGHHHPHHPQHAQLHQHHQRHQHHRHRHQHHRQVAPSLSSGPVWFRVKLGLLLLRLRTSIWARVRGRWEAFLRHWPLLVRRLKESFGLVMRLHLMMFYFHGLYFHLSKRVTSVQYIYTGKSSEQRPRFGGSVAIQSMLT